MQKEKLEQIVSLDGIDEKMETRLIKHLAKEMRKTSKMGNRANLFNNNNLDDTQAIFGDL